MTVVYLILWNVLNIYSFILLIRAVMSWFRPDPYHPIVRLIYNITEPILGPLRSILPPIAGFDFSILVAYLIIFALNRMLAILLAG